MNIAVGSIGSSTALYQSYITQDAASKTSAVKNNASEEAQESPAEKLAEAINSGSSSGRIDTYA